MEFEIRNAKLQLLSVGQGDGSYPAGIGKIFRRRIQAIEAATNERVLYQLGFTALRETQERSVASVVDEAQQTIPTHPGD